MSSEEKLFFEKILDTDEIVLWTGRPLTKAYKIRNIERMLIDFVTVCAVYFVFYSAGYFLLQTDFDLIGHTYNGALLLSVVLLIYTVRVIKRVSEAESVLYCITNKRILIMNSRKKQTIRKIDKRKVKEKRIIESLTHRRYNVRSVKLVVDDEEDLIIESIENADKVLGLA